MTSVWVQLNAFRRRGSSIIAIAASVNILNYVFIKKKKKKRKRKGW